jgi:hypothetical protein
VIDGIASSTQDFIVTFTDSDECHITETEEDNEVEYVNQSPYFASQIDITPKIPCIDDDQAGEW